MKRIQSSQYVCELLPRTMVYDVAWSHRLAIYDLRRLEVASECCTGRFATDGVWEGARGMLRSRQRCSRSCWILTISDELQGTAKVPSEVCRSVPRKCFGPRGVCASR
jgi:hypothetical protein